MRIPKSGLFRAAPILLAGGLLTAYMATIAPGLTWANGGSDGGDLIAAAATRGIAHPTGYPVYLLTAGLFQLLPVGSLAFRTNLLSAVATVTAALLVSETVRQSRPNDSEPSRAIAGLVAGAAFGFAPLVWSQAIITEVYALHGLFVALLLYLVVVAKPTAAASFGMGLTLGLAGGNHMLALLMLPAVLLAAAVGRPGSPRVGVDGKTGPRLQWGLAAIALLGLAAGLSSYAILPLRAANNPPVNWGAPVTLERMWWLVSGSLYQDSLLHMDLNSLWTNLHSWAGLVLQQDGFVGLGLALAGLVFGFSPSRIYLVTLWAAIAFTAFSLQYAVVDAGVHLMPVFLALAIWMGLGVAELGRLLSPRFRAAAWLIGAAALSYALIFGLSHWQLVDASEDTRAEDFGTQLMNQAPPDAIVFAEGDRAVFGAWYFHHALRLRPDLVVIADSLLPFDWYRENLQHTYPGLELPPTTADLWVTTIQHSNSERAMCFASTELASLACKQGD